MIYGKNPLTRGDYPDVDVIRVDDTYYMVSTTMYFQPGGAILRSYDLVNWELLTHVYDTLDDTDRQNLVGEQNAYSCGMWAPVIRYHEGVFHVIFIANDTHKTYHYTATDIMGPWKKSYIEGFYHDTSLLFDDDGKVYLMYGGRNIWLTEMEPDLSKPKEGGFNEVVIQDKPGNFLGFEGCHLYKINGKYYAFFIHSHEEKWFRSEAAFMADDIHGPWTNCGDVIDSPMPNGTAGSPGVAQGGIVDTPDGRWFGLIFSDHGAVGRIPNLVPMHFAEDGTPVFDIPSLDIQNTSTRPDHKYAPLFVSDDFDYTPDESGKIKLNEVWEFNHNPNNDAWTVEDSCYVIKTDKIAKSVDYAHNTLTQRTVWSECEATLTIDGKDMLDGDCAGLTVLQYQYGLAGIAKEDGEYYAVMRCRQKDFEGEKARIKLDSDKLTVKACCYFGVGREYTEFFALLGGEWVQLGEKNHVIFDLKHFTGARYGIFNYATKEIGGVARFDKFTYTYPEEPEK